MTTQGFSQMFFQHRAVHTLLGVRLRPLLASLPAALFPAGRQLAGVRIQELVKRQALQLDPAGICCVSAG